MLQKFFLFQFWITFVLTISLKDFAGRCKTRFNSWKKNYHLLLMIFLQALLMKPRRPVNQNKQILVKKISPIWHWFYIFQQNLSKKLLRQMLVRTEKGRTFIKWRTSRKNVHVIIIPTDVLNLINHMKLHVNGKKGEDREIDREIEKGRNKNPLRQSAD